MTTDPYAPFSSFQFDRPVPGLLRITFNRPEKLNTLDAKAHRELVDIWPVIDRDPEVLAVILAAKGRAFSAGGDFAVVEHMAADFNERARMFREARDLVFNIVNCAKPIVSAIQGAAAGAGLAAAMMSDIPIVARNAKLLDGHMRLGVAAGDHAALLWPLLCGMARAKYYLLLNEPISGQRAADIGLVALAVEETELEATALSIATRLVESSPSALQWTKHSLNNWLRMAGPILDTSLALEMLGFSGPDTNEGVASFKQKRPPKFSRKSPV